MSDRFYTLGRITAGAAHDLSNYLTIVHLSLASARRLATTPEVRRALADACEGTQQAIRLTGCLLEYARGGVPASSSVDLVATVHRLLALFAGIIPEGVRVVVDAGPDVPPVVGVATELEQLVLNLVVNACDAMPRGGELAVRVGVVEGVVCLDVADTGAGVDDATRSSGADGPSTKPGRNGIGLGLGIVRGVAERHGAEVQLAPRPRGGTLARVVFANRAPATGAPAG